MRLRVCSLASLTGLRIRHCHEPRCMLKMWFGTGVAVAQASGYCSDSTPSLGTSICCRCSPRKDKKKKKEQKIFTSLFFSCIRRTFWPCANVEVINCFLKIYTDFYLLFYSILLIFWLCPPQLEVPGSGIKQRHSSDNAEPLTVKPPGNSNKLC